MFTKLSKPNLLSKLCPNPSYSQGSNYFFFFSDSKLTHALLISLLGSVPLIRLPCRQLNFSVSEATLHFPLPHLCFFLALVLVNSLTIHPMAEADNLREMWWMGRQQERIGWDEWRPVAVPPTATFSSGFSLTHEKTEVLSTFPGFMVMFSVYRIFPISYSLYYGKPYDPEHRSDVEPLDNSHSAVWLTLPFSSAFPNTISPCILSSHLAPLIFLSK